MYYKMLNEDWSTEAWRLKYWKTIYNYEDYKLPGKKNLSSKRIPCYREQCSLSEDSKVVEAQKTAKE